MASIKEEEMNPFTIIWKFENFETISCTDIYSPSFCIKDEVCRLTISTWRNDKRYIQFNFSFINLRNASNIVPLTLRFSLLQDGDFICLEKFRTRSEPVEFSTKMFEINDGLIAWKEKLRLPSDAFTVAFRIRRCAASRCSPAQLFLRTQLGTLQTISCDRNAKIKKKKTAINEILLASNPKEGVSRIAIARTTSGMCEVTIDTVNINRLLSYTFETTFTDGNGNSRYFVNEADISAFGKSSVTQIFQFFNTNKRSSAFLSQDTALTLHCDLHLKGILHNEIEEIRYGFEKNANGCGVQEAQVLNGDNSTLHPHSSQSESLSAANAIPIDYDCSLETKDKKTFPVHKAILSVRSPVFKTMFEADKWCKNFLLSDLDNETLQRLLLFVYTDTVDDLDSESARKLIGAANRYKMTSLEEMCSQFLKVCRL